MLLDVPLWNRSEVQSEEKSVTCTAVWILQSWLRKYMVYWSPDLERAHEGKTGGLCEMQTPLSLLHHMVFQCHTASSFPGHKLWLSALQWSPSSERAPGGPPWYIYSKYQQTPREIQGPNTTGGLVSKLPGCGNTHSTLLGCTVHIA